MCARKVKTTEFNTHVFMPQGQKNNYKTRLSPHDDISEREIERITFTRLRLTHVFIFGHWPYLDFCERV